MCLGLYSGHPDPAVRGLYSGICDCEAASAPAAWPHLPGWPGSRHPRDHHLLLCHGEDGSPSEVLPEVLTLLYL